MRGLVTVKTKLAGSPECLNMDSGSGLKLEVSRVMGILRPKSLKNLSS